jgi:4-hydroxy-tetrahydrodipicolinate synthase
LRTKRLVTAPEYAQIAADHPNLVATKNSTDSMVRIRELIEMAPQPQHFFGERGFVYGSMVGECGLLISIAALHLQMGQRYFEAGRSRDFSSLLELEREIAEITREFIHCMGDAHIDGAYDKALWRMHDPRFPLRLLPPYAGVDAEAVDRFAAWLRVNYPRWTA